MVETARLTLRRLRRGDEDAFLAVWTDPDVWQAIRPGTPFDSEHGSRRFHHHLQHWEKHSFGLWLIDDRTSGDTLGWVGSSHPDYVPELTDEIEIGWSLRRGFWGRGMATEGARAAVSAALEHLRPIRLISLIDPENFRSVAVAERLGMHDQGPVEHAELDLELRLYALAAPANSTDLSTAVR
ncbi:MAG: GNAT family N-acetyltransferase [Solirubrobacterales bacterium]